MSTQFQDRLKKTGIFFCLRSEYSALEVEMADKRRDRNGDFGHITQSDRTYDPYRYRTDEKRRRAERQPDPNLKLSAEYGSYGRETDYGGFRRGDDLVFGSAFGRSMGTDQSDADPSRRSHAGRGPKNYRRPDERIREDVCERLKAHPLVDATEIEVDVRDSVVMLKGKVIDRKQKRFAEEASEAVRGVQDVKNGLTVHEPARKGHRH
jgi:osmotically-inducible protein OsmY